jgi:hypothetical protein
MFNGGMAAGLAIALAVLAIGIAAAPANAASTRSEYVAQVDPICLSSQIQAHKVLRKHHLPTILFLDDLRSGDRKTQLRIAKSIEVTIKLDHRVVNQIAAVLPPPGDEGTITKWVADLRRYTANEVKAVHAIRADKGRRAYRLIFTALRPLIVDNQALKPFGFEHCTF